MASEVLSQGSGSKGIVTFYPTMEEFKNFSRYVAYIESQGAHKAGLAKIVPPKEWSPRGSYEDIDDLVIPAPIQQVVTGQSGLFTQYNIQKKSMTVREFRKIANSDKFCSPRYDDFEELERKYWKNVTFNPPIYGADVNGSLYKPGVKEWNICHLNTILDTVESESGITIEGVTTPYLYFGMWKTTFAWHTEDMDLYSVNYLHFGEPKSWYCIPPEHGKRFERLAKGFFPGSAQNCEAFLRHKMTLISPSILKKYGIPFDKITQEAGEFMITFPYGYHAGFNHGFNCAESTNFATERWIDYGKHAVLCTCRKDMVKISMDVFVKKFQPERYSVWLAGKDTVPIDHSRPTPEAKEFLGEAFPISNKKSLCTTEICADDGERNGVPQRIETKRHRVCLEVPDEVVPKEEEDDDMMEYGKRPRLNLMPQKSSAQDIKRSKGPPKLVVTPTKLTLMNPFQRGLNLNPMGRHHSAYMKINTPPVCQTQTQNGNPPADMKSNSALQASRKMGVASLLFHRTKSSKDAIQVQSYATVKSTPQQHPPLQLQVHSYAREHQPQNIQFKASTLSHVQSYEQILPAIEAHSEEATVKSSPERPASLISCVTPTKSPKPENHSGEINGSLSPKSSTRKLGEELSYCKSVVAKRQQKDVLCQLPRHHPLFREDEEEIDLDLEFHWEEKEEWAKPVFQMWQCRPYDPVLERNYNKTVGEQAPYCSICLLFYAHHQSESNTGSPSVTLVNRPGGRHWSKPLIPEMCFHTQSKDGLLSNPRVAEDGTSRLVSCSQCCVRVHASCYGVSGDEDDLDDWLCARCEADATEEDCCLCSLRGGALQRANSGKWVHVLCAITVMEARFVNITERSPIDISSVPVSRFKLKCVFCRKRMKREVKGCCVQCSHGRCPTSFHPTCALAAGVVMHPDDWPLVVFITCLRHRAPTISQGNKATRELTVRQRVIAKCKNGRYYHSEVAELSTVTFYEVVFDDGSYSDNLFPEDIQNRDCVRLGPPAKGAPVEVRWTDGLTYGAKFVASHSIPMYQVEFEDGSQISLKREDIYALDEDLPKRVKSRMSVASDMRFELFTQKEVQQTSKRQRVVNSRYREDYIEPVIYRAIME